MISRNLTVNGKTVFAPNISSSVIRESSFAKTPPISQRFASSAPISQFSSTLKSTDQTTLCTSEMKQISKESMTLLRKQIEKLCKLTKELVVYNHSSIFDETDVLNELNTLRNNFQTFYHDSVFYYKSIKAVEESFAGERIVPNAAIKSSSLTFGTNWGNVNGIFIEIQQKGKKSLSAYVENKYKALDQIICKIGSVGSNNLHKERLNKTTLKLREFALSQSKHSSVVFNEKEIKNATKIMEDMSNDVKQLIQRFDSDCFHVYSKCSVSQIDLKQYKSLFHSTSEEIIMSIRAFFSFDGDMKIIGTLVNEISEHIQQIITIAELPPCPIRNYPSTFQLSYKTRNLEPIRLKAASSVSQSRIYLPNNKGTPVAPTSTPNLTTPNSPKAITKKVVKVMSSKEDLAKIESFISFMRKILNLKEEENRGNAVEKLESLQKEAEEEILKERQQYKENLEKENKKVVSLQSKVKNLEEYTKILEDQLNKLKEEQVEGKNEEVLQKVVTRMEEIVSQTDSEINDDLVSKPEKLNLFVIEKRCPRCMQLEKMQYEMIKRLNVAVDNEQMSVDEKMKTIVDKIDDLNKEITDKDEKITKIRYKNLKTKEAMAKMQQSMNGVKNFATKMLDKYGKKTIDIDNIDKDDPSVLTMAAFEAVKKSHDDKANEVQEMLTHKHRSELREIAEALEMCDEETVAAITKSVKKIKTELKDSKAAVGERDHVLNKLDVWMSDHIAASMSKQEKEEEPKTIDEKFQNLMFQFDEAPNPLERPYEELSRERRATRESIEKIISKMSKLFTGPMRTKQLSKQLKDIKVLKIAQLLRLNDEMIATITEIYGSRETAIVQLTQDNSSSKKAIINLCEKVIEFLQKPVEEKEMPKPEQSLYELTSSLTQLTQEVCDSGTEKFIPKDMLVKEVKPIQNFISFDINDPKSVMEVVVSTILDTTSIVKTSNSVHAALNRAFQNFDFNEIPDINSKNFTNARDLIFQVNSIIRQAQIEQKEKIGMPIINLLSKFISVTNSLFSLVAMRSFERAKDAKAAND